ncbi:MAG: NeuD/PglB/VioB family sugar acetyltransferase [Dermatophilaceae bacterium]
MSGPLLLLAASGLAREVAESARRAGWDVLGCLDDDPAAVGSEIMEGLAVLGGLEVVRDYPDARLLHCAGKGQARRTIVERLCEVDVRDDRYAVLVDPSVVVPPSCTVGSGSILLAGTILTASVSIGRHVVCMPHVVLTHDDVVADYATLASGVVLGGGVLVGLGAYLGAGATVRPRVRIGAGSVLGMGATLVRDMPADEVWVGVPATQLKERA